jgi:hypothetical protein
LEPDGYVRIAARELQTISLRHLLSQRDDTIAVVHEPCAGARITGFTEWIGSWEGAVIAVGWDWGVIAGEVIVLNPAEIRTNVLVVLDRDDGDVVARRRNHLLRWIEALRWRDGAIADLLQSEVLE